MRKIRHQDFKVEGYINSFREGFSKASAGSNYSLIRWSSIYLVEENYMGGGFAVVLARSMEGKRVLFYGTYLGE